MISVVLAIHNEAANLQSCLDAVKSFADEIVIVDGESTDESVAIAKANAAKVISTTNKSNFHINKQMAMDAAKGDLILQLDADEIVDAKLARFIVSLHKKVQAGDALNEVAWQIPRKNLFLGSYLKKGGQYPDMVIRLYLARKARLPQKDVHEQMEVDGAVGIAEGHFLHHSNPTFKDYLRKFNTYTTFSAQQLHAKHVAPSFFMGIQYVVVLPCLTFLKLFLRHRGYVDGIPGFVFALMSALHFPIAYIKLWELAYAK